VHTCIRKNSKHTQLIYREHLEDIIRKNSKHTQLIYREHLEDIIGTCITGDEIRYVYNQPYYISNPLARNY
jgi:hypothetical protein